MEVCVDITVIYRSIIVMHSIKPEPGVMPDSQAVPLHGFSLKMIGRCRSVMLLLSMDELAVASTFLLYPCWSQLLRSSLTF